MSRAEPQILPKNTSSFSDQEVIDLVLKGERDHFEIIMRRYNRRLYRVARSVLGAEQEVEDVMQVAYLKAYKHLQQFAGRASFLTWLTKIVFHEALSRRKRQLAPGPMAVENWDTLDTVACVQPGPVRDALDKELSDRINAAIDRLPLHYRVVFVMRAVEGVSTEETARCLSVSRDVVKSRLSRAKAHLRQVLRPVTSLPSDGVYPFHLQRCDRVVNGVLRAVVDGLDREPCDDGDSRMCES